MVGPDVTAAEYDVPDATIRCVRAGLRRLAESTHPAEKVTVHVTRFADGDVQVEAVHGWQDDERRTWHEKWVWHHSREWWIKRYVQHYGSNTPPDRAPKIQEEVELKGRFTDDGRARDVDREPADRWPV